MSKDNRLVKAKEVEEIFNYEVSVADKDPLDAFDSAIQNAATVDAAEVVHGRMEWIPTDDFESILTCSVCKKTEGASISNKFCPNCGAKMDGDSYDSAAGC